MTRLLEQALTEVHKLPEEQQGAIAALILDELTDERRWRIGDYSSPRRRPMLQTVEAVIDDEGRVQLLGEVHVSGPRRALLTVMDEPAIDNVAFRSVKERR